MTGHRRLGIGLSGETDQFDAQFPLWVVVGSTPFASSGRSIEASSRSKIRQQLGQLKGTALNLDRLRGALGALTDNRLGEYLEAVPDEWRSNNTAADRIVEYLQQARQNRDVLFAVITHLLA